MNKKPAQITEGQRWTFCTRGGKRVAYILGEGTEQGDTPAHIAQLVNVETGGIGWVTKHWLRKPEGNHYGWFVFDARAEVAA